MRARVTFLPMSEGGRRTPAMSGIRPRLKVGDRFTSCIVRSNIGDDVFLLGQEYEVELELVFRPGNRDAPAPGDPVELFEGGRRIATGRLKA
ncbi:hypothetical protein SLA_4186 [Streptomyces laurentii]|uniref:Uncharacterized protein n=1 Tax=Streptomyces laurentii TaxID=39478 RepID=A0A160P2F8_STRLU|nr:hypothetical protein SLA_4186 [Streptomyces laurentii]